VPFVPSSRPSLIRERRLLQGWTQAELARRLDEQSDAYEAAVVADHRRALAQGIAAVPTVVIDHEYLLQGALRLEQYRKVVERLTGY